MPALPSGVISFNLIRLGFAPLSFDATLLADSTVVVAFPCLTLFVNGVYMRDNDELDPLVSAGSIVAIEVYERPNLVPIEFQAPLPPKRAGPGLMSMAGGCGALAVWTRGRVG